MSGLLNSSINGSSSNLQDNSGRAFPSSFSAQSGATSPGFHHSGSIQGLHNMHTSFNIPNMPGSLNSRNSSINIGPSGGIQQPSGSLSSGRFTSNNIPIALSQISHGSSHGHSGVTNRGGMNVVGSPGYSSNSNVVGGSIPGILPTSAALGNRNAPGLGVSPLLGSAGPRITSSMGGMVGSGNIGRNIGSGGGMSVPGGLQSRLNLTGNSGSGSLGMQGQNRLMNSMLQQASPQVMSMLGNSYPSGGGGQMSQNNVQGVTNFSSLGMLNDANSNDNAPFDINDFPLLTSRPNSAGGPQGQIGSLRKQGLGVSSIVQQNQEFSIQNEDFPALPFKGGGSDFSMDLHHKEQLHDNMSGMQPQHFSVARSTGFSLGGGYSSNRLLQQQQQQQHTPSVSGSGVSFSPANNQELSHMHGSDMFSPSHSYHLQGGAPGIGLRPMNSPNSVSNMNSYDQLMQQYQQHQSPSQFRLQQQMAIPGQQFRDQGMKSMQASHAAPDPYGLLGLLSVIRMSDPDLTSLALGIDLTTLGLNLNSSDNLYKTFGSPWSEEPAKGEPEFVVPQCFYSKSPPTLHPGFFPKFRTETLFYIFYSMPRDEAQLCAADELMKRGWLFHRDLRMWLTRVSADVLATHPTYERASFICFDPHTWETVVKENFVLQYDAIEKKPQVHLQH